MSAVPKKISGTLQVAKIIAELASDKKAEDILLLDMRKQVNFCDYFVICSALTDRQVRAIADGIEEGLAKHNIKVSHRQGLEQSTWIVLDLGDIIIHVLQTRLREFYMLENLWRDAKKISWGK